MLLNWQIENLWIERVWSSGRALWLGMYVIGLAETETQFYLPGSCSQLQLPIGRTATEGRRRLTWTYAKKKKNPQTNKNHTHRTSTSTLYIRVCRPSVRPGIWLSWYFPVGPVNKYWHCRADKHPFHSTRFATNGIFDEGSGGKGGQADLRQKKRSKHGGGLLLRSTGAKKKKKKADKPHG